MILINSRNKIKRKNTPYLINNQGKCIYNTTSLIKPYNMTCVNYI
ncbi:Uncharacterised protein [Yersinia mollaretii]|nr:Uncharacterised protein [Yersinia mollaretii]CQH07316.1 Uncharacterised protein [Yersinia mollaretii]